MRKIIVEAEVSLDGAMGGENVDFWTQIFPFHSADVQEDLNELLFMPDALLIGRKTYEGFAQVWPTRQGEDADRINTMLQHGLVDEFRFLVFPFAFGDGPLIFEQIGIHTLKLLDTKTFSSGVVAHRYQPQKQAGEQ